MPHNLISKKNRFPYHTEMEIWSEIRNIHLKSMLSERCGEPKGLLEAVIKQAHSRGQLTPRCRHFQTPDHLRNTPGNCTPKSSWQWRCHQKGADSYQYLSGLQDGEEEQMICPNLLWVESSDCHEQGWAQETPQLLPVQFYDKGRDCSSGGRSQLCFRGKALTMCKSHKCSHPNIVLPPCLLQYIV